MKYKAILFDMNGVLVDDEHLQEAAFREVLETLGCKLSSDDYIRYFIGKTDFKGYLDYFQGKYNDDEIKKFVAQKGEAYRKLASRGVTGFEGVKETVKAAHDAGYKLAVVTGSMSYEAVAVLDGLGLQPYFLSVIAAEDVKNGKPDPEGYLRGAQAVSCKPSECIVVEDAPSGIAAAQTAGMFSVAVLNTHQTKELHVADLIVKQLSPEILSNF